MAYSDTKRQAHFFRVDENYAGENSMCIYCTLSGPRSFIISHVRTCANEYFRVNRNEPEPKKQKIEEIEPRFISVVEAAGKEINTSKCIYFFLSYTY